MNVMDQFFALICASWVFWVLFCIIVSGFCWSFRLPFGVFFTVVCFLAILAWNPYVGLALITGVVLFAWFTASADFGVPVEDTPEMVAKREYWKQKIRENRARENRENPTATDASDGFEPPDDLDD